MDICVKFYYLKYIVKMQKNLKSKIFYAKYNFVKFPSVTHFIYMLSFLSFTF